MILVGVGLTECGEWRECVRERVMPWERSSRVALLIVAQVHATPGYCGCVVEYRPDVIARSRLVAGSARGLSS